MHKRTTGLVLAGVLAAGAAGAVAVTPASATTSANPVTSRLAGIKGALSGLVSDGTLTQSQADKVASTLDKKLLRRGERGVRSPGERFGGMGMGMAQTEAAAAKALGLTPDKLRVAMQGGKSLAAIAKDQNVSVDSLVSAMVRASEARLATAVKEGRLTQAQADKMKTSLTKRITDRVNGVRPSRGTGHGPGRAGNPSGTGASSGGMRGPVSSPSTLS